MKRWFWALIWAAVLTVWPGAGHAQSGIDLVRVAESMRSCLPINAITPTLDGQVTVQSPKAPVLIYLRIEDPRQQRGLLVDVTLPTDAGGEPLLFFIGQLDGGNYPHAQNPSNPGIQLGFSRYPASMVLTREADDAIGAFRTTTFDCFNATVISPP